MAARDLIPESSLPTAASAATATNQATTATNQATSVRQQQTFAALTAAGEPYASQWAGGAAVDSTGPFDEFLPPRTVRVRVAGGGSAASFTVDGETPDGAPVQFVVVGTGAGEFDSTQAVSRITRFRSSGDVGAAVDLLTGPGFGLGVKNVTAIDAVGVDGVVEVPTSKHLSTGAVTPATAPDGAVNYCVNYRVAVETIQNAHTHVQDSHFHTIPAP